MLSVHSPDAGRAGEFYIELPDRIANTGRPFPSAQIAQIDPAKDAPTHDPTVGQFRPIAGAYDTGIARAQIKHAVGIAAERELLFEPIHRDLGLFLLSKADGKWW
jgi:hypothetical protein